MMPPSMIKILVGYGGSWDKSTAMCSCGSFETWIRRR